MGLAGMTEPEFLWGAISETHSTEWVEVRRNILKHTAQCAKTLIAPYGLVIVGI